MNGAVPWIIGAVVLVVVGILAARAAGRRGPAPVTVDRARSLLSRLDLAIDQAEDDVPADRLAEARRLRLVAGAALAGDPDADAARRSVAFSERALRLLS